MAEIKTTLSTRLGQADAEFLQRLEVNGARTPSEKLRKLVAQARQRAEGAGSYRDAREVLDDLARPALAAVAAHEHEAGTRSEALAAVAAALPEALAAMLAAARWKADDAQAFRALEARVVRRTLGLAAQLMRLDVAPRTPCYDPSLIEGERAALAAVVAGVERSRTTGRCGGGETQ